MFTKYAVGNIKVMIYSRWISRVAEMRVQIRERSEVNCCTGDEYDTNGTWHAPTTKCGAFRQWVRARNLELGRVRRRSGMFGRGARGRARPRCLRTVVPMPFSHCVAFVLPPLFSYTTTRAYKNSHRHSARSKY